MNRHLNRAARGAVTDVHAAMLLVEAGRWTDEDALSYEVCAQAGVPVVLVINKIDRLKDKSQLLPFIANATADRRFEAVHPVSALKANGLDDLVATLLGLLPESAPLYDEDEITDRSSRFLAGELVREQLMHRLGDELPYAAAVEVEEFGEDGDLFRIGVVIWVERDSQKAIVVGRGGEKIKAIGQGAREGMERLFGRKVFLRLWCKVREGWADDERAASAGLHGLSRGADPRAAGLGPAPASVAGVQCAGGIPDPGPRAGGGGGPRHPRAAAAAAASRPAAAGAPAGGPAAARGACDPAPGRGGGAGGAAAR